MSDNSHNDGSSSAYENIERVKLWQDHTEGPLGAVAHTTSQGPDETLPENRNASDYFEGVTDFPDESISMAGISITNRSFIDQLRIILKAELKFRDAEITGWSATSERRGASARGGAKIGTLLTQGREAKTALDKAIADLEVTEGKLKTLSRDTGRDVMSEPYTGQDGASTVSRGDNKDLTVPKATLQDSQLDLEVLLQDLPNSRQRDRVMRDRVTELMALRNENRQIMLRGA